MDSKTVLGEIEALKSGRMSEEMIVDILKNNIGLTSHGMLVIYIIVLIDIKFDWIFPEKIRNPPLHPC